MKLSLTEIKIRCKDKFFNSETMKFFKGCKYSIIYNKDYNLNFICVYNPEFKSYSYHLFNEITNETKPLTDKEKDIFIFGKLWNEVLKC